MAGPSFADCRAAARSVRSAEHGVRAARAARPGTTLGIVRDRGPLSVLLHVAREGRLVWQSTSGFAVLTGRRVALVFTILAAITLIALAATHPVVV